MFKRRLRFFFLVAVIVVSACGNQGRPSAPPPPQADVTWWNDRVFYEIFVRSFQDSDGDGIGDLAGLTERLDYLNDGDPRRGDDLGVTGLWLMPVTESPSYHGYDVADYRAVERDYGDAAALKTLIKEAHQRDMVVIVDLVINHTSSEHPWFQAALADPQSQQRDWYLWSEGDPGYRGPWGQPVWHPRGDAYYYGIFWSGMPDLNYRNPEVTDEIYEITRFWLQDMGVDGFRMDAIRHLIEDGSVQENTPETHQWLRDYYNYYKSLKPEALTVGEVWTRTEDVVPYVGDELDICFEFDLASAILSSAEGGYASTVAGVMQKVDSLYPPQQYATFLTNHDHERTMTQLDGEEAQAKVAAAIYLTLPGVPFIYYGEEIGMTGPKPDERIRTPMQWSDEPRAGFTAVQPWYAINDDYQQRNVAAQLADEHSLLNHYRALIRLRASYSALRTGDLATVSSADLYVYAYLRYDDENALLAIHNLSDQPVVDYALSMRAGPLRPGTYRARDLLAGSRAAELAVGDNGAFDDYLPLSRLQPNQSVLLLLH
jgi:glycosidase